MSRGSRSYYAAPIDKFLSQSDTEVLGEMCQNSEFDLDQLTLDSWIKEIEILQSSLSDLSGVLLLEYAIPRMGRRADAVLLLPHAVIVLEFKVGEARYTANALDQVFDYALDLKNFHEQSHNKVVIPVLVATEAPERPYQIHCYSDDLAHPVCTNKEYLGAVLRRIRDGVSGPLIHPTAWIESIYRPTPTIVEAAQALYRGHNVQEISRSESGATNLTKTAKAIADVIDASRAASSKAICFVTGVPGAGKTLAGLNIANSWNDPKSDLHAVFLSGNGPLVDVLREALARDDVEQARTGGKHLKKSEALTRARAFIQNVHHFRDDSIQTQKPSVERIVVFDEAQRAWNLAKTASFMKTRKKRPGFNMSEPDFLLSVMDRHKDWAVVICLIGGGQEINTGEAGLAEWFDVLRENYPQWRVFMSGNLQDAEFLTPSAREALAAIPLLEERPDLHLAVSLRSFRSEKVSVFVKALLDCDDGTTQALFRVVSGSYPIFLTRNLALAKRWLRDNARGSERFGLIASSEAQRLRPFGIFVSADIDPTNWFLNDKTDIRSSFFLEDAATEFQIQGLELDWTCVAWDADLRHTGNGWDYHCFRGTQWLSIKNEDNRRYLKNAYRVLLTRARQGMVIFVPEGNDADETRCCAFYDRTFEYLQSIGIPVLSS